MTNQVIKLSDLSPEGVIALRKCEAAERFTTVPGKARGEVYLAFQEVGLVEWRGGYRLTADGRRLFDQWSARHGDGK